jgi:thioredoxin-related protein
MHFLNRYFTPFAGMAVFAGVVIAFFAMPKKIGSAAPQSDALWLTDYKQALAQATQEKKSVLLDFTGSDWCPYCVQMDREVLNQREFIEFAKNNLVLVKLDFPRRKQLPLEETEQNHKLGQQFEIEGYPTYILVDPTGKEVKRQVGYLEGGPKKFIEWVRIPSRT